MQYVIGDIHGEISKLIRLIDFILRADPAATFIFIGDYIDKGENSKEVLAYLIELESAHKSIFLMGNHEYYWLNLERDPTGSSSFLQKYGAKSTLKDFSSSTHAEAREKMMSLYGSFFNKLCLFWENQEYIVTHSGLSSQSFVKKPESFVETDVLFNRYDFLKSKKLYSNKKIIFGHTSFFDVFYDGFKIGIDTGACYFKTQPMTALNLSNGVLYNSEKETKLLVNAIGNSPNIIRHNAYAKANKLSSF